MMLIALACSQSSSNGDGIVVDELASPRGLAVGEGGSLLIAETGGGRVLQVTPDGEVQTLASELPYSLDSGPGSAYPAGPSAVNLVDGELFVIIGEFRGNRAARLYRIKGENTYEGVTPETDLFSAAVDRFSNPYDFVSAPEVGGWIVSDSGRNALLAVDQDGSIHDYAVFDSFAIPGREALVEVVPTGIARGPGGALYVGSLTGFPYPEGAAVVWRVEDKNGDGDAMDDGEVEPYVTGLTTVTDVAFGPGGTLYIGEFSSDLLAVIQGGEFGENSAANPGRVLSWDGSELTVVVEDVVSPTGLLATDGTLYISEEFAGRVSQRSLD